MGLNVIRDTNTQNQNEVQQFDIIGPEFFKKEADILTKKWIDDQLDYSIESLKRLDQLVDRIWPKERIKNLEFDELNDYKNLEHDPLVLSFGSYFGEVLIRQLNGKWIKSPKLHIWVIDIHGFEINVFYIANVCFHEISKYYAVFSVALRHSGRK